MPYYKALFYALTLMIRIPGTTMSLRLFDDVATVDEQYNIVDVGIQYEDGAIDSLAVGGSFHSLKRAVNNMNSNADAAATDVAS
jgi:hypothetical protein